MLWCNISVNLTVNFTVKICEKNRISLNNLHFVKVLISENYNVKNNKVKTKLHHDMVKIMFLSTYSKLDYPKFAAVQNPDDDVTVNVQSQRYC